MSLGRAWYHGFPNKLAQAHYHGIRGVEIFYEDLEYHARSLCPQPRKDSPIPQQYLLAAAKDIRRLCTYYSLDIICLQPFMHFGGIIDREQHGRRIKEMLLWIQLAHALNTDLIAVPSSFLPPSECTSDISLIVSDMQEIAVLGLEASPPIRFCFEALCWGTQLSTWEESWEVVQLVDSPNFGLCLDTFNIAGRIWADPSSESGKTPNADVIFETSLARLRNSNIPLSKLFLVQLVDAERLSHPLVPGHEWYQPDQPARMSWSRNARLFPFETERGAYLPVMKLLEAITNKDQGLGYEGYISMELFNRSMGMPGKEVPAEHAERAMRSWGKVFEHMGWTSKSSYTVSATTRKIGSAAAAVAAEEEEDSTEYDSDTTRTASTTSLPSIHDRDEEVDKLSSAALLSSPLSSSPETQAQAKSNKPNIAAPSSTHLHTPHP